MNQSFQPNVEVFRADKTAYSDNVQIKPDSHGGDRAEQSHTSQRKVHFLSSTEMINPPQCIPESSALQRVVPECNFTASTASEVLLNEPKELTGKTSNETSTNIENESVDFGTTGSNVKRGIRRTPTPHPNDMRKSLARRLAALQSDTERLLQESENLNDTIVNSPANGTDSGNDDAYEKKLSSVNTGGDYSFESAPAPRDTSIIIAEHNS